MDQRLTQIHARLVELGQAFEDIPIHERHGGPRDQPIRDEANALRDEANVLLPVPPLPQGFHLELPEEGEVTLGIHILPDRMSPPELWGRFVGLEDANTVLAGHGLEVRPTWGDFFLARIGTNTLRDVGLRIRLCGPADRADEVAHLFLHCPPDPLAHGRGEPTRGHQGQGE
jgi:hypothetical protein